MRRAPLLLLVALNVGCHGDPPAAHRAVTITGEACADCHAAAYRAAPFDHASVGFGTDCEACHTEVDWAPTRRPAHAAFVLDGAHAAARCSACHAAGRDDPQPLACVGCHAADRAQAQPDHANLPTTCQTCHTTTAWRPAALDDHDRFFPLEGAHAELDCARCHVGERYAGTPRECLGCHAADRATAVPVHETLPPACAECHTQVAWRPSTFGHETFAITGAHTRIDCQACHADGRYAGTPRECVGCHAADRDRARPDHTGFPEICTACHTDVAWRPASGFDHEAVFPLRGAHAAAPCGGCHVDGVFAGTPRDCVGCHADDRARAQPDHAGFPLNCGACHGTDAWRPAALDHDQLFPLLGAHQRLECGQCHVDEVYAGTPRACVGCHAGARDGAALNHAGFPGDCAGCHGNVVWRPANFDHQPVFPLVAAHAELDCDRCHRPGAAAAPPRACVGCHRADRDDADPNHGVFADDCARCHSQLRWAPSTYAHRIRVPHHEVRNCADCHTDRDDYPTFSCTHCHRHARAETDRIHREVRNYAWVSQTCYDCHILGIR